MWILLEIETGIWVLAVYLKPRNLIWGAVSWGREKREDRTGCRMHLNQGGSWIPVPHHSWVKGCPQEVSILQQFQTAAQPSKVVFSSQRAIPGSWILAVCEVGCGWGGDINGQHQSQHPKSPLENWQAKLCFASEFQVMLSLAHLLAKQIYVRQ